MSLSLSELAARLAVGTALMIGPILACNTDDEPFYYGSPTSFGGGTSSGVSSSGGFPAETEAEVCTTVEADTDCYPNPSPAPCEHGESANANCNGSFSCEQGTWVAEPPQRAVCAPTSACPAAFTSVVPPDLCKRPDAISLICEYDEGTCGCAPVGGLGRGVPAKKDAGAGDGGDGGSDAGSADAADAGSTDAGSRTYEWTCVQPDRDAGCPRRRPREGLGCVRPLNCDYGYCEFEDGYRMDCYRGQWVRDLTRSERCDR